MGFFFLFCSFFFFLLFFFCFEVCFFLDCFWGFCFSLLCSFSFLVIMESGDDQGQNKRRLKVLLSRKRDGKSVKAWKTNFLDCLVQGNVQVYDNLYLICVLQHK